jgi:predicted metal-dependent phosphoesterase TrpH
MGKKLKVDLHLHSKDDIKDRILHSNETLIDEAAKQGYDVLAITNHDKVSYSPKLADYAKERGILLIPGYEAKIQNKHILLYNFDSICTSFDQIRKKKDKNNLVIAPHPFYPGRVSLNGVLMRYLDVFDALEYCHYHHEWINFNKKAADLSREKNIPMVGTSDTHQLFQLGLTYSLVEAEKDMLAVFEAIKQGKIEIFTHPLSFWQLINIRFGLQFCRTFRKQFPNPPRLVSNSFTR